MILKCTQFAYEKARDKQPQQQQQQFAEAIYRTPWKTNDQNFEVDQKVRGEKGRCIEIIT